MRIKETVRRFLGMILSVLMVFPTFIVPEVMEVEALINYTVLDFSDIKDTYNFDGTDHYGDLASQGWELTKENEHDYVIKLHNAHIGKLVLPMDDADKDCDLGGGNCGVDPRLSNVTIELTGQNIIEGYDNWEDGLVGQYVKKTTFKGNGRLKVLSNHGINIYSDLVIEDGLAFDINSRNYGIATNHSLTIKGGKFNIVSLDSALISSDDMKISSSTIIADMNTTNGGYRLATKGVIEALRRLDIDKSKIYVHNGPNGIYANDMSIKNSTISDDGKVASEVGIYSAGGMDSGRTTKYDGKLTIQNSNVILSSKVHAILANDDITIDGGNYVLKTNMRREATLQSNRDITIKGKANLNVEAAGYGIASAHDNSVIRFESGTNIYVAANPNVVADISAVDQYAVFADDVYIASGVSFEGLGGNSVFNWNPTFGAGAFYIEAGAYADNNPRFRYAEAKSKEYVSTFHSMFRYVKIVPKVDLDAPVITGYEEGKTYCNLPTITVTDETGIDKITVNGVTIRDFSVNKETEKRFMVPILNSPIKEVVATDVLGNKSVATFTAYNGCKTDITISSVSHGKTYAYNGKEQKPIVSVYYLGRKLQENADYKVTYSNNVDPGTATITITGMGGFEGTIVRNFTIEKAANDIVVNNVLKPYSSSRQVVSLGAKQTGDSVLTYSSNNDDVVVDKNGTVTIDGGYRGSATITITAKETKGYKKATKNVTVNVQNLDNVLTVGNVTKTYNKKAQSFNLNVKQSSNARLTYSSNNKNIAVNGSGKVTIKAGYVGSATITIKAASTEGYNSAVKNITVTVNPSSTKISKLTNVRGKKLTIKWSKNTNVTGYQIQYSTDKNFRSGVKTITISKNKTTSKTISKLKKGKKYYVRIRTYKKVSGKKYYSAWSSVKNKKVSK